MMGSTAPSRIPKILETHEADLLDDWLREQSASGSKQRGAIKDSEVRAQCVEFLRLLKAGTASSNSSNVSGNEWGAIRELLADITRSRGIQGFSPTETATFVFS